jgi:hypothetical protein
LIVDFLFDEKKRQERIARVIFDCLDRRKRVAERREEKRTEERDNRGKNRLELKVYTGIAKKNDIISEIG